MTEIEMRRLRHMKPRMRVWHPDCGWGDFPGESPNQATQFAAGAWGLNYREMRRCQVSVIPETPEETARWWRRYFPDAPMPEQETEEEEDPEWTKRIRSRPNGSSTAGGCASSGKQQD